MSTLLGAWPGHWSGFVTRSGELVTETRCVAFTEADLRSENDFTDMVQQQLQQFSAARIAQHPVTLVIVALDNAVFSELMVPPKLTISLCGVVYIFRLVGISVPDGNASAERVSVLAKSSGEEPWAQTSTGVGNVEWHSEVSVLAAFGDRKPVSAVVYCLSEDPKLMSGNVELRGSGGRRRSGTRV